MKNLFVVAELLYNKISAILVEKVDGRLIVHGSEEEELQNNVFDIDGVLDNFSIVSSKLTSIVKKMENRAVALFDNKQAHLTRIDLAFSCFPFCAYEDSANFNLNYNQTIDYDLIEVNKRSYNFENTEDKVVSWYNDLEYYIDGVECSDPKGKHGNALKIKFLALSYSRLMEENIEKVKARCNFDIKVSFSPILESSVFIQNKIDKDFAIVAIKQWNSYVEVYSKSKMRYMTVIPFGLNDVFNDLKYVLTSEKELDTPLENETLKDDLLLKLLSKIFTADKKYNLKILDAVSIEARKLYDVVESRFNEIFTLAKYQIDKVIEPFDGAFSIGMILDKEQSAVCDLAKEFFKTDCTVLTMRNDFFESSDSLPSNPATLLGLAMQVDTPSFEVLENDVKIEDTPYIKNEKKAKRGIISSSLKKFEGLFAGENGENNEM